MSVIAKVNLERGLNKLEITEKRRKEFLAWDKKVRETAKRLKEKEIKAKDFLIELSKFKYPAMNELISEGKV